MKETFYCQRWPSMVCWEWSTKWLGILHKIKLNAISMAKWILRITTFSFGRPIVEYSDDSVSKSLKRVFVDIFFTSLKIQLISDHQYYMLYMILVVSRCKILKALTYGCLLQIISPVSFRRFSKDVRVWRHNICDFGIINIFQALLLISAQEKMLL